MSINAFLSGARCAPAMSIAYGNGHTLKVLAKAMAKVEYPGLKLPPKWSGNE